MKKWAVIKIILSLGLVVALLQIVDRKELVSAFKLVSLPLIFTITVAYIFGQALSAYKWHLLMRASGINLPYSKAFVAFFTGMFVNFFGLGLVGGDLTRGLVIASASGNSKSQAVTSVVADRTLGLAVLAAIGVLAGIVWGHNNIPDNLFILIILFGASISLGWLIGPWLLLKIVKPNNRFRLKAEQVAEAFPKNKIVLTKIVILSALYHCWQIGMHFVIANSLSSTTNWSDFLVSVPFVNILSSLPISWNGLGVRESGYVFFLTPSPLTQEIAIAMGAVWLLATTLSNLLGGFIAFATGDFKRIKEAGKK